MHTLPPHFLFFVFLPWSGVVDGRGTPTTSDPTRADVADAIKDSDKLVSEGGWRSTRPTYQPEIQRRLDEAASDALELFCARLGAGDSPEEAQRRTLEASRKLAEAAEGRFITNDWTHPEDEGGPLWHPHN